jgi:hypothetical protein
VPRQNSVGHKAKPAQPRKNDAEIERLLDQFDQAILSHDREGVTALTQSMWQHRTRLPEFLTRRVVEGRAAIPAIAMEMLGGFAGPKATTFLRRIADQQNVPDIVRFGAQRRSGWPERGATKRRLAFLESLENPDQTLVVAIDQGTDTWPPECEILDEVLGYLAVLPSARAQKIAKAAVDEVGERASWLLHALLELKDASLARCAIRCLEQLHDVGAIAPLRRLARSTGVAALRKDATTAAEHLAALPADRRVPSESKALPTAQKVLLSVVDGAGAQTVLVTRQIVEDVVIMANYLSTDSWGIKDTFGQDRVPAVELPPILEEFESAGVSLVEVDLAACRGVMQSAVDVNGSTGQPIPPVFELWEPFLHEIYPPPVDEPVVVPELDDAGYAGRADLLKANGKLFDHRFFESWAFAPEDLALAMFLTPVAKSRLRSNKQFAPLVEAIMNPATCARYRQRLRRQAWLLDRVGDAHARDLALATAASLDKASPADLAKQPFFLEMASRTFEEVVSNVLGDFGMPPSSERGRGALTPHQSRQTSICRKRGLSATGRVDSRRSLHFEGPRQ